MTAGIGMNKCMDVQLLGFGWYSEGRELRIPVDAGRASVRQARVTAYTHPGEDWDMNGELDWNVILPSKLSHDSCI